ncbi:hypothetical protein [Caballeronia grimmiae]|uniref:hypothetical protein n=1 Tax=Caballeronia grimmiae TaxID=1071679 RepID=UPI0038B72B61
MATGKQLKDFDSAGTISDSDVLFAAQGGVEKKMTAAQLAAYVSKSGVTTSISSTAVAYQASASGTVTPTGTWVPTIPAVTKGQYLWTRTTLTLTDSSTVTSYSVAYQGADGAAGSGSSGGSTTTMSVPVLGDGTVVNAVTGGTSAAITYAGSSWTIGSDGAVYRDGNRQSTGAGAPFSKLLLKTADGHLYGLTTANLWWSEGAPWTNVGATDPRQTTATVNVLGDAVLSAPVTGKIANEMCFFFVPLKKLAIAAGMPSAKGLFLDAATASTTYTFSKNGVQFATATIAAGGTAPTFSDPATIVLDPANNDYMQIIGPATPDSTLGRGGFTILAEEIQ